MSDFTSIYSLCFGDAEIEGLIERKRVHREDLAEFVYLKGWLVWPDGIDWSAPETITELKSAVSDATTIEDAKKLIVPLLKHLAATGG